MDSTILNEKINSIEYLLEKNAIYIDCDNVLDINTDKYLKRSYDHYEKYNMRKNFPTHKYICDFGKGTKEYENCKCTFIDKYGNTKMYIVAKEIVPTVKSFNFKSDLSDFPNHYNELEMMTSKEYTTKYENNHLKTKDEKILRWIKIFFCCM